MKLFLISISFFTRLPIPRLNNISNESFYKSMLLIPIVGFIIGIFLYFFCILLNYIHLNSTIKALLILVLYLYITGSIHFDGVADTIDALYSNKDNTEIISVMKDLNIGTFGNISLIIFILSLFVFINQLVENNYLILLIVFPIIGRFSAIEIGAVFKPNIKNKGLGYNFCYYDNYYVLIGYIFVILILLFQLTNINCIISFFIIIISNLIIGLIIVKKTNGVTGDILGLIIELSQLEFLLCFIILENILG